jgi:excisionase family DNA binding protein
MSNAAILLTVEQAAEKLQIGRSMAYQLIAAGELASIKIGRVRRVPVRAIEEYVERLAADAQTAGGR